ncbi:hypothetical protein M2408_001541 [Sphingobacterium sp. BIGb0165]|nr:hypothetical protein [Sphingobacterium sp. BIGb0165]
MRSVLFSRFLHYFTLIVDLIDFLLAAHQSIARAQLVPYIAYKSIGHLL